jgi:CheY-like chemotaxis protein
VVDDEAEILEALHIVLENMGYLVVGFTSGVEALDFFRTHQEGFDLVITDQTMPRLTGEDLAREILALRPGLPVILCTGFSEAVPRERALALGIREIVTKPVFSRELARVIQRALAPGDIKG